MKSKNLLLPAILAMSLSACQDSTPDKSKETATTTTPAATTVTQAPEDNGLNFTLTNLKGENVQAADYRGKWLVLNYWATWCGPCRDEMPELVKFQANNPDVQILGIAYEDSEIEKLQNFVKDFDINYPILTIDVYNPPAFAEEGGLGLPTTIVYDKAGVKHEKHMGPIDYDGLMAMVGKTKK